MEDGRPKKEMCVGMEGSRALGQERAQRVRWEGQLMLPGTRGGLGTWVWSWSQRGDQSVKSGMGGHGLDVRTCL